MRNIIEGNIIEEILDLQFPPNTRQHMRWEQGATFQKHRKDEQWEPQSLERMQELLSRNPEKKPVHQLWFHATPPKFFEAILQSKKIKNLCQRAYPGAFVSSRPEYDYGAYVFVLDSSVIKEIPILSARDFTCQYEQKYWAGLAKDIDLTKYLRAVIYKGYESLDHIKDLLSKHKLGNVDIYTSHSFSVPRLKTKNLPLHFPLAQDAYDIAALGQAVYNQNTTHIINWLNNRNPKWTFHLKIMRRGEKALKGIAKAQLSHTLTFEQSRKAIRLLLAAGIPVIESDGDTDTSWQQIVYPEQYTMNRLIKNIQTQFRIKVKASTSLHDAIEKGNLGRVQALISAGAEINQPVLFCLKYDPRE